MIRFLTIGNAVFMAGAALEVIALGYGVHTVMVGWATVAYGIVLLYRGYLQ